MLPPRRAGGLQGPLATRAPVTLNSRPACGPSWEKAGFGANPGSQLRNLSKPGGSLIKADRQSGESHETGTPNLSHHPTVSLGSVQVRVATFKALNGLGADLPLSVGTLLALCPGHEVHPFRCWHAAGADPP